MGFQSKNLTPVSVANSAAGRVWKYKYDTDSLATIKASAYFSTDDTVTGINGNNMALSDEDIIIIQGSDGVDQVVINITTAGLISVASTGNKVVADLTATNALTASQSGSVLFLNSATEFVTTLPAPSAGLNFEFICKAAPSSASYTVVTASSANLIIGHINEVTVDDTVDGDIATAADTITFTDGAAAVGDWCRVVSDGTSWYVIGQCAVATGIALSQAS